MELTTERRVKERLGGYVKLSLDEEFQATAELSNSGHSIREIAAVTGLSKSTVSNIGQNKAALAGAKARETKLGTPPGSPPMRSRLKMLSFVII
jgi:hypothetical protein